MWRSSGTTCAARGCTHNWLKLKNWMKSECFDHRPKTKKECSCPQWYSFHRLPKDNLARANWLKNLRLRKPPKMLHVCSFHFVDKRPTDDNPYPTLFLGSEDPPAERRPRLGTVPGRQSHGSKTKLLLDSTTSDLEPVVEVSQEQDAVSKTPKTPKAKTKKSKKAVVEHNYFKGPAMRKSWCISDDMLKDDACCLLYTGIPLQEFNTLVSCLHGFATMTSEMPIQDQILLTLMKIRYNCDISDLASQFKTSQLHACETLKYWTEVTNSLVGANLREKLQST